MDDEIHTKKRSNVAERKNKNEAMESIFDNILKGQGECFIYCVRNTVCSVFK